MKGVTDENMGEHGHTDDSIVIDDDPDTSSGEPHVDRNFATRNDCIVK